MPELVASYGPWVVFLLAFLETAFITGLVMPTGPAIIVATALAVDGRFALEWVAVAAVAGGGLGDTGGFWVGRRWGRRVLEAEGFFGRSARRALPRAAALAVRHPLLGVSFARLVSFVRTLAPQLAGMSRLRYPRFLAYDLLGLGGWATLYVALGLAAERGWEGATRSLGMGWAVAIALVILVLWGVVRWRRLRPSGGPPEDPSSHRALRGRPGPEGVPEPRPGRADTC